MSDLTPSAFSRLGQSLTAQRWAQLARKAHGLDPDTLRRHRARARSLRRHLDAVIREADCRLHAPGTGPGRLCLPHDADWGWRPAPWCGRLDRPGLCAPQGKGHLDSETTLFHDCPHAEVILRQQANGGPDDLAPFALCLDVFRFEGSYLSLAINLPDDAIRGLHAEHVIHLETDITAERPLDIYARLNVQCGPNVSELVRAFPSSTGRVRVAFDLAYARLDENRIDRLWLDICFDQPAMNAVMLRDLTLHRRPRAAF